MPQAMPAAPPAPPPPPVTAPAPPAAPAPRRLPPANLGPIDPNLPPDEPIEPGSGLPRLRAGARIAASEAALGGTRPAEAEGGKSSFIAAARRAAKAAMQEASARMSQGAAPAETEFEDSDQPSPRAKLMKRIKSLLIVASIVAIAIGAIQIMGNLFSGSPTQPKTTATKVLQDNAKAPGEPERPVVATQPQTTPQLPGNLMAPALPPMIGQAPPAAPSLLSPPALNLTPPQTPKNDITGSIPNGPAAPRQPIPVMPATSDKLPIAIGSTRLRTAAAHGDAAAAYEVATRFAEGRGVPVSYEEAARWYDRAAGKGLALAQFRYATLLEKGQGVKKDLGHARRLYLAAANQGNAKAMHNLAVLYAEGIEGRPDYATAAQWFRKAANRGIADSQYNLGVLCARGLGTEKSLTESYKWFALAGAQGDKESVRKRDEVASQLKPNELAAAQQAAKGFVAEAQPHAATAIPVPPGGWDESEAPASGKARSARPLALGTFNVGKR
jgi:localization factor PodJL